ncbi:MAG: signal peptidase II [Candidatus Moranbacteria bacterium]|jgi:signal peptidase II|nr:signal peptidase II [Candidatus Moranbacteria bacterium]
MGNNNKLAFLLPFFLIFCDQLLKYMIRQNGGFYICNQGIAFGIRIPEIFFWIFLTAVFFVVASYIRKNSEYIFPLLLTLSGAFSNTIDRIFFGCVIDFIDIKVFNYPLFNLADVFIVTGVILLIIKSFKSENQNLKIKSNK